MATRHGPVGRWRRLSFARMLSSLSRFAFSSQSRQDQDVFEITLLLLRAITIACRGHYDVVLENLALRHQLANPATTREAASAPHP